MQCATDNQHFWWSTVNTLANQEVSGHDYVGTLNNLPIKKEQKKKNFSINLKMVHVQGLPPSLISFCKSWKPMQLKFLRKHKICTILDTFTGHRFGIYPNMSNCALFPLRIAIF